MSGKSPAHEFGKRRPIVQPSPQPQAKRSNHVALLVMGTLAVGGGAYGLMPRESCVSPAPSPGMAAPALPQATPCTSRGSSYGGSGGSGGGRSFGWSLSSRESAASSESSGGVSRGGFGAMAHAFGFSGG